MSLKNDNVIRECEPTTPRFSGSGYEYVNQPIPEGVHAEFLTLVTNAGDGQPDVVIARDSTKPVLLYKKNSSAAGVRLVTHLSEDELRANFTFSE